MNAIYALMFAGHMLVTPVPYGPASHLSECLAIRSVIIQTFIEPTHRYLERNLQCVRVA